MTTSPLPKQRTRLTFWALLLAFLVLVRPASAHRDPPFGGKYPHNRGYPLGVGYSVASGYQGETRWAMTAWHNTPTLVYTYETSQANARARFYSGNWGASNWWGIAYNMPCSGSGCTYSYANIYLNDHYMSPGNDFQRKYVIVHEFGHNLGLSHYTSWWGNSIMRTGGFPSYNTPQSHDINDVNSIYPF
jgi:hypothetical protein